MSTTQAKTCIVCQQDVSSKPRSKDAHGRYVCKECEAKAVATGAAKRASDSAHAAKTESKPEPLAASKPPARSESKGGANAGGYDLFADVPQPCPSCSAPMKNNASVCTICGFNKETGQALRTRVSAEKGAKKPAGDFKLPVSWDIIAGAMAGLIVLAGVAACVTASAIIPFYIILSINGLISYVMTIVIPFQDSEQKWGAYNLLAPFGAVFFFAIGSPIRGLLWAIAYPIAVLYYVFAVNYRASLRKVYLAGIGGSIFLVILVGLYGPEKIAESAGLDPKDFRSGDAPVSTPASTPAPRSSTTTPTAPSKSADPDPQPDPGL